jgi:hypothetical protein
MTVDGVRKSHLTPQPFAFLRNFNSLLTSAYSTSRQIYLEQCLAQPLLGLLGTTQFVPSVILNASL